MLTLYTQKHGKVRVVARGARRITSKLLGFTELFTLINCQIDFRSSIPVVSQISHERIYDGIAADQRIYEHLHFVAELVDRGCEELEANESLFELLADSVHHLVASHSPATFAYVLLSLTSHLGFSPQLSLCAACGEPLRPDQSMRWSETHGGVVTCSSGGEGMALSLDEVKALRYFARSPLHEVQRTALDGQVVQRIGTLLVGHAQYVLDRNFQSAQAVQA